MTRPQLHVDFNATHVVHENAVAIRKGSQDEAISHGLVLEEGAPITCYDDDADDENRPDNLLCDGLLMYDGRRHNWFARLDMETFRHESEERPGVKEQDGSR